jgi:hypothetical protein
MCTVKLIIAAVMCMLTNSELLAQADKTLRKPSLAKAKAATTVGQLLEEINANDAQNRANFLVYVAASKRYVSPRQAGLDIPLTATLESLGGLQQDPDQIQKIKNNFAKAPALKRDQPTLKKTLATVDTYAEYLLYFIYLDQKIYINDPWPAANAVAVANIIKKWGP